MGPGGRRDCGQLALGSTSWLRVAHGNAAARAAYTHRRRLWAASSIRPWSTQETSEPRTDPLLLPRQMPTDRGGCWESPSLKHGSTVGIARAPGERKEHPPPREAGVRKNEGTGGGTRKNLERRWGWG